MIVLKTRKEAIGFRHEDQAAFGAYLLEEWNDQNLKHDERREQIIMAAGELNIGWREFDENPRLDPKTKLPVAPKKLTPEEVYEIWMRGSRHFLGKDPYVALLITHHAYTLHEHTQNRTGIWEEFFVKLAQQRGRLRDALGLTHNDIEHGYSYLRMAEWLSLNYLTKPKLGAERPMIYAGYKVARQEEQLRIRPYPFVRQGLTWDMPVIPLEKKGYASQAALKKALKTEEIRTIVINPLEL